MKRIVALAGLLISLPAFGSATLTVNSPVVPSQYGAYIQLDLTNCATPTILNSGTPVPMTQKFYLNGQNSITFTVADNITQIVCTQSSGQNGAPNFLSTYTVSYVFHGTVTPIKVIEVPPGTFNVGNLANVINPPYQPGAAVGPPGEGGGGGSAALTGNGTPTATGAPCTAPYGSTYLDTSVNPNGYYVCGINGWQAAVTVNYGQTFTNLTTVNLLATASQLSTQNAFIQCYDTAGNQIQGSTNLDPTTKNGTVNFAFPQSGLCVLSSGAGGVSSSSPVSASQVQAGNYPAGNFTYPGLLTAKSSPFPSDIKWIQDGASVTLGFNTQGDIGILAQSPGAGYTNAGTCQVVGGTFTTQASCQTALTPVGGIVAVITAPGSYTAVPTAINTVGSVGGTGFTATPILYGNPYTDPFDAQLLTLSALNGRVASFTNYAVSGTTVVDASQRYVSNGVGAACSNPGSSNSMVVYSLGGDVLLNAINGETSPNVEPPISGEKAFAQWAALTSQAVKDGCFVVAYTPTAKDGDLGVGQTSSGYETSRAKAAALMRSQGVQCTSANRSTYCNYDVGVDLGGLVQNTHDNDVFNPQDRTHFNHGGERQAAALANKALMLSSAFTDGIMAPLGTTFPYMSVTGNGTELINSLSLGFNVGTSYLDSWGGSAGAYGGFIVRSLDGTGTPVNVMVIQAQTGNTNVSGGFAALGGAVSAQANTLSLPALSTSLQYNAGGFLDAKSATSTPPSVTIRGINSTDVATNYVVFAANTGKALFSGPVVPSNGYSGFVTSVGQFCSGILISTSAATCP